MKALFVLTGLVSLLYVGACKFIDSSETNDPAPDPSYFIAAGVNNISGRSIVPIDIDAGVYTAATDGLAFGSTWTGVCPNEPNRLSQGFTGYVNGAFQTFHHMFDAYRAVSIAFAVPASSTYDLTRKCNGPLTYPEAGFFSFGTSSARAPVDVSLFKDMQAEEDGIVTASVWLGSGVTYNAVTGYESESSSLDSSVAVAWSAIKRQAGDGGMVSANVTFPVKKGHYYAVRAKNSGAGTYPTVKYVAVPGLGIGNYEIKTHHTTYTASSDGFVVASAWTGNCKRGRFQHQRVDGYMTDESGIMRTMAVRSDYGDYRALSILYPVLKGRQYKVGMYCTDSLTYATVLFVPLED